MASETTVTQIIHPLDSQTIFANLRNVLTDLYPEERDTRVVVADAGLDAGQIAFSPRAQTNWHNILMEAVRQNRLSALLDSIRTAYGDNAALQAVAAQYSQFIVQGEDSLVSHLRVPLDATLYTEPTIVAAPAKLFGRQTLLTAMDAAYEAGKQILLTGLGGIGKTALAATFATAHLRAGKGSVVWMRCGNEHEEALLEELVNQAEKSGVAAGSQGIKSVTGDAKIKVVREALARSPITLIVLDDARNSMALRKVQRAIPNHVRLLVTSRRHFSFLQRMEIDNLTEGEALDLLGYAAGQQVDRLDPQARALCKNLGYHPFALELAGAILQVDEKTPAQLLRRLGDSPHNLVDPDLDSDENAHDKAPSIKTLLNESFDALDEESKLVFCAFGALFVPGATAALLALYTERSLALVETALDNLARRSLAKRRPQTDYYAIHDLTFSYTREKIRTSPMDVHAIVQAVERFVVNHAQDFDRLEVEQSNILGAARVAPGDSLLCMMSTLAIGGYPNPSQQSYLNVRGHTLEFLERMDQAIQVARAEQPAHKKTLHYLLTKRGNTYIERGEIEQGLVAYRSALAIAPNSNRRIVLDAAYGFALANQGKFTEAHQFLDQGYNLARQTVDEEALLYVLGQMSYVAGQLEQDYEAARRYAVEVVEISRRLNRASELGYALIDLGSAEFDLGIARAMAHHREAIEIARSLQDDSLLAIAYHALGIEYHALQQFEDAQEQLLRALTLYRKVGNTASEARLVALLHRYEYIKPDRNP